MSQIPLILFPGINTRIQVAGQATLVFGAPLFFGGIIVNPGAGSDQGLTNPEPLFITLDGTTPALKAGGSTIAIYPGKGFAVPAGSTEGVWATSASAGHNFSAVAFQEPQGFEPSTGAWPPTSPTTLQHLIPSYLYVEYNDDESLQAFISSFNELFQSVIDWFNDTPLPVYTDPAIVGPLLDWVGTGLYGYARPSLPSGYNTNLGPFNTFLYDQLAYNQIKIVGNQNVYVTTDDIYKRLLTWHLYKGDGKVFNVRWLKRRIFRFLFGTNGTDLNCSDTSPVSVTFGGPRVVNIFIGTGTRSILGGCLFNLCDFNAQDFNGIQTQFHPYLGPPVPFAPIFKSGVEARVIELPFQDTYNIVIS